MLGQHDRDIYYMRMALKEAQYAGKQGEVPVGAVVVWGNQIIAKAHNQVELLQDVTAHAEILAITAAENYLGAKYLVDCTLYVTLEPCVMCGGACHWSKLKRLVYGAPDAKRGFNHLQETILHPKTQVTNGILEPECLGVLQDFFRKKR
ncbi:MAG: nucleoside deaminase [Chitinophagales bacterium]